MSHCYTVAVLGIYIVKTVGSLTNNLLLYLEWFAVICIKGQKRQRHWRLYVAWKRRKVWRFWCERHRFMYVSQAASVLKERQAT